jgi:hypothetical protein
MSFPSAIWEKFQQEAAHDLEIGSSNSTYHVNSSIANANICHPLHVRNLMLALQVPKALKAACGVVVKPRPDIRPSSQLQH